MPLPGTAPLFKKNSQFLLDGAFRFVDACQSPGGIGFGKSRLIELLPVFRFAHAYCMLLSAKATCLFVACQSTYLRGFL